MTYPGGYIRISLKIQSTTGMNGFQRNENLPLTNWALSALIQQTNIALWYIVIFWLQ